MDWDIVSKVEDRIHIEKHIKVSEWVVCHTVTVIIRLEVYSANAALILLMACISNQPFPVSNLEHSPPLAPCVDAASLCT